MRDALIVAIGINPSDYNQAIAILGDLLHKHGFVEDIFVASEIKPGHMPIMLNSTRLFCQYIKPGERNGKES